MNYPNQTIKFKGIITEVTDGSVALDIDGRLGFIKVPKRMVISDKPLEIGQSVSLRMSYIEVKSENQEEHVQNLREYKRREAK
ncbi:CBO2463/CBO2479 domain-containing protein [Sporohalobacter salinus]|uniref:CBO2463/CBO2479 domain-containing protein n=1 Tax=Sporohalobacter salinus TaxID=1494606 RepID=UPI0019606D29|nr:hypothetical protein [Sporohalobacter salinus]